MKKNNTSLDVFSNNNKTFNRFLNHAYRYLSYKPRSIYEMTVYLEKKGINKNIVSDIVKHLINKNYLDDDHFADWYIKSRTKYKPKSKFAIGYELKQKGIKPCISEKFLSAYDDFDLALKAVANKTNQWENLDCSGLKKKLMNYLKYRGFSYEVYTQVLYHIKNKSIKNF